MTRIMTKIPPLSLPSWPTGKVLQGHISSDMDGYYGDFFFYFYNVQATIYIYIYPPFHQLASNIGYNE